MVVGTNLWCGNKKIVVRTKRIGVKENNNTRMIYKTTILVSWHKIQGELGQNYIDEGTNTRTW
jgi:hypothetical protein